MTYNKTNWQNGDIITADKLNNLENGVFNNDASIASVAENAATKTELNQVSNEVADLTTTVNNNTTTLNTKITKTQCMSYVVPSNQYLDITVPASGTPIAAPFSGYFCVHVVVNNQTSYQQSWMSHEYGGRVSLTSSAQYTTGGGMLPVAKGQKITLSYQQNVRVERCRWLKLQGVV